MTGSVCVFVQARMSSSRFPGKVLAPLFGRPLIQHVLAGVRQALIHWEAHEAAAMGQTEASAPGGGEQAFWNALRLLAEEQVKTLTSFR